jgi:hypothetical protein
VPPNAPASAVPADTRRRRSAIDVAWLVALTAGAGLVWLTRVSAPGAAYVGGVGDVFGYFLPAYEYQAERMAAGSLPFWNPYQGGGVPFLATLQAGALYPARLLLLVASPTTALAWSTFLHVVLALLGTYAFCRRIGTGPFAAAMAAIVYATAFALPWIHATPLLEPGAWLPLLATAVVAILRGGGWGWVLLLGAGTAMPPLAGGYQVSLYTIYGLALVALGVMLEDRARGRPPRLGSVGRLAVAGVLAFATAAPQVLPTVAWSDQTMRQTKLLTTLQMMPLFTADARWQRIYVFFARLSSSDVCHLSVPVIALAAIGLVAARPMGLVFGAAALVTAYFTTVGPDSIGFQVYKAIPGFGMFRFPSRLLVLTAFFTAATAALGLERLVATRPLADRARRRIVEAAALGLVVWLLVWPYRNTLPVAWSAGPDLAAPDPRFFPGTTRPTSDYRVWSPGGRLDLRAGMFVRQGMRHHVRVLQDYDPLSSARLGTFLTTVAGLAPPRADEFPLFTGALLKDPFLTRPELLDLVAVRAIMAPMRSLRDAIDGWTRVGKYGDLLTYRNDRALPRAYVVERAQFVPDEAAALEAIVDASFDAHAEAVLVGTPDTPAAQAVAAGARRPAAPAAFALDDPEHIVVPVDRATPGVLVLADAFAPGWEASVDGRPRTLWQTNYLVRGVILEPGDRRVEFRYRAPGFAAGVSLLAGAWTVVLLGLGLSRMRAARS